MSARITTRVGEGPTGERSLRILAVSALWHGANDYAFVRAFRRAGHSVSVMPENWFVPPRSPAGWRRVSLRALRRVLTPVLVREYTEALIAEAEHRRPDFFFVFKGTCVTEGALKAIRSMGAISVNFYPDTGIRSQSPYLEKTLPLYDWVFTTKSFGLSDMEASFGVHRASFLPHAFDPETHSPVRLSPDDRQRYECDASFIGAWSPKKERLLAHLRRSRPNLRLRIWGGGWKGAGTALRSAVAGRGVTGTEYAKAIRASGINLGLLYEGARDASSGDLTTARTFEIPAAGGFMLHERTEEAMRYFADDRECVFFSNEDDLVAKLDYYLERPDLRQAIAAAALQRAWSSGYSVDSRVETILKKYVELGSYRERFPHAESDGVEDELCASTTVQEPRRTETF